MVTELMGRGDFEAVLADTEDGKLPLEQAIFTWRQNVAAQRIVIKGYPVWGARHEMQVWRERTNDSLLGVILSGGMVVRGKHKYFR